MEFEVGPGDTQDFGKGGKTVASSSAEPIE